MTRRFRAPGRVNLMGDHTDYSGGLVLPAALERGVTITGDGTDGRIELTSDRFPDDVAIDADGGGAESLSGWGRYVAAVAGELAELGRPPVGLRGRVTSDLPHGAGLSSSAALEVAVAIALCEVADFALDPMDLAAVGQRAEYRAVGVPCGIMDQAASVLGRADHAVLLDCGTFAHRLVPLPADLSILVIDSRVSRRLEESGYATRRSELEEALTVLGERRAAEVHPDELSALTQGLAAVPTRRLRHVVTENARVRTVAALLEAEGPVDLHELGRLFAASHGSLRDEYEVSTPELDLLVELAREAGAVAARMTGGGFGGSIVALAPAHSAEAIGNEVAEQYSRLGHDHAAEAHVCRAGDGAGEITGLRG